MALTATPPPPRSARDRDKFGPAVRMLERDVEQLVHAARVPLSREQARGGGGGGGGGRALFYLRAWAVLVQGHTVMVASPSAQTHVLGRLKALFDGLLGPLQEFERR
jgi:hypothetical protein